MRFTYRTHVRGHGRSVGGPKAAVLEGFHPVWMMVLHGYTNGAPPHLTISTHVLVLPENGCPI